MTDPARPELLALLRRMEAGNLRGVIRETILAAQARAAELSKDG